MDAVLVGCKQNLQCTTKPSTAFLPPIFHDNEDLQFMRYCMPNLTDLSIDVERYYLMDTLLPEAVPITIGDNHPIQLFGSG
jgi:hypothetical protein